MEILNSYEAGKVLLIDKPLDWTSFDVVRKIRNACKCKKVGHAGTLDPLATGLLIICTGKFTKQIDNYQAMEKEYTGTMRLGATTPSFDGETEINREFPADHLTEQEIRETCTYFIGETEQLPPIYSAVKIDGKRAFNLARKGREVEMKPRTISISEFEITGIEMPFVHFRVVCSKGTYIRSLASDFGRKLSNGAYLTALRRTRIGDFRIEKAKELEAMIDEIRSTLIK